jgi:hypothetical protein
MNTHDPFESYDYKREYQSLVQEKLEHILETVKPSLIASVIRKVLENLVLTERLAEAGGTDVGDTAKRKFLQKEHDSVQDEVNRAVGEFIGSILSREGG